MRFIVMSVAVTSFALFIAPQVSAAPPDAQLEGLEEQAFQQAAARVAPSVVKIETVGGLDRVSGQLVATGPTTGVVVAADGWIISSAFNFIAKPTQVLVTMSTGKRLPATVIATDRSKMLTLLKVDAQDLPVPVAAPRDALRVGQWAIALGRTLEGESPSVSVGIISALQRIWGKAIQTDAKISPINYGGPLVDIEGRVQGILVPLSPQGKESVAGVEWYDSGIGFAIPLTDVLKTLEQLKKGTDLLAGLVGINFKSTDEFAGDVLFDRVRYDSPAQKAGFKPGDIVTEFDHQKVNRIAQFRHILGTKYAGDKVHMSVKRGTEQFSAEMTLVGELEPYEAPFLGILPNRPSPDKETLPGISIRTVFKDSPAEKAGLKPADRILKANGQDVADSAALWDRLSRLRPAQSVALVVQTDIEEPRNLELKLGTIPDAIPAELEPSLIPPPTKSEVPKADAVPAANDPAAKPNDKGQAPKTGLITEKSVAHNQNYWAYVPTDYNPAYQYALVVWLHPAGDTFQAAAMKGWKAQCDERGIILLAPKALLPIGWQPNEFEFVKDLTEEFMKTYSIDRRRVVLHGMGAGGNLAYLLATQERQIYRAVLTIQTPMRQAPPDHEPDFRLQFFLVEQQKSPAAKSIKTTAEALRKLKFPVSYRALDGEPATYPAPAEVSEFARWIDLLDRL
jgi:serine protease Do